MVQGQCEHFFKTPPTISPILSNWLFSSVCCEVVICCQKLAFLSKNIRNVWGCLQSNAPTVNVDLPQTLFVCLSNCSNVQVSSQHVLGILSLCLDISCGFTNTISWNMERNDSICILICGTEINLFPYFSTKNTYNFTVSSLTKSCLYQRFDYTVPVSKVYNLSTHLEILNMIEMIIADWFYPSKGVLPYYYARRRWSKSPMW